MYILNEKDCIRTILVSKQNTDKLSIGYLITLIAKYYYSDTPDAESLSYIVKEKIAELKLEQYQEYKYHNKIMKVCENLFQGETDPRLKERNYIPVYEKELATVRSLKNDRQKKLLFTLFVIARYMECNGWINKKDSRGLSEVFKLANITLPSDKKNELLHELYCAGHISFSKKIDNLNIRVNLENDGEIAYKVKEFSNIGNQYIGNFKKGYKQCQCCGKKIRDTGNKRKYCEKCAYERKLKKNKSYYHGKSISS